MNGGDAQSRASGFQTRGSEITGETTRKDSNESSPRRCCRRPSKPSDQPPITTNLPLTPCNYPGSITEVVTKEIPLRRQKPIQRLGPLQLQILKILWSTDEPQSVQSVQEALSGNDLAYTTIATMLRKMEDRRLVRHKEKGRKFLYEAVITEAEASQSMTSDLVERMFEGSLTATVSHLLETHEVDPKDLAELERLIRRHKRQKKSK